VIQEMNLFSEMQPSPSNHLKVISHLEGDSGYSYEFNGELELTRVQFDAITDFEMPIMVKITEPLSSDDKAELFSSDPDYFAVINGFVYARCFKHELTVIL
jgi:hypothetical protein